MQQRIKVFGPPGTGKTTYCLDLLCEHLQAGESVSFLTYSKAAQLEAEGRLIRTFSKVPENATVKTIHATCMAMLAIPKASVFSPGPKMQLFYAAIGAAYKQNSRTGDAIREALALDNYLANTGNLVRADANYTPFADRHNTEAIIRALRQFKTNEGYVDFNDMLLRVAKGEGTCKHHDVVIIDEAQDLTTLQWEVAERLYGGASHVYVVGDDDQCIYSYNGADVRRFLSWTCDAVKVLGYTYRLPKNILTYSQRIITQVPIRQAKEISCSNKVGNVYQDINTFEEFPFGTKPKELYLVRNNHMKRRIHRVLADQGVPYSGKDSPYTDFSTMPARIFRGITIASYWVDHEITYGDWAKMKLVMRGREHFMQMIEDRYPGATKGSNVNIPPLQTILQGEFDATTPGWWRSLFPEIPAHWHSQFQLALSRFTLAQCASPSMEVSTIHAAKGKEADRVYVCSALTDKLYHGIKGSVYDEHRLFYVAATRTKQDLMIIHDHTAAGNQYPFPKL